MEFLELISEEKTNVDKKLKLYFSNLIRNESDYYLKDYFGRLRNFIYPSDGNPAKRIRPIVLIHSFFGSATDMKVEEYLDAVRELSLSIELMHNASLIHDDVCEKTDDRRGLPTLYKSMESVYIERNQNKYGNSELWSNSIAIYGGNFCSSLGGSIIMKTKFPREKKYMALKEYLRGYEGLVKGKVMEKYLETNSLENSTLEDYLLMAEFKTSQLFISAGLMGFILAEGRNSQMEPIRNALKCLGIAYQIKYDIMDMYSESKTETLNVDIKNRKRTIPIISAYKNSQGNNKKEFDRIFESTKVITDDEVKIIKDIIVDTNALEFAKMYQKNMIQQANIDLELIYPGLRDETHEFFKNLFEFSLVK